MPRPRMTLARLQAWLPRSTRALASRQAFSSSGSRPAGRPSNKAPNKAPAAMADQQDQQGHQVWSALAAPGPFGFSSCYPAAGITAAPTCPRGRPPGVAAAGPARPPGWRLLQRPDTELSPPPLAPTQVPSGSVVAEEAVDPEVLAYQQHQATAVRLTLAEEARTLVASARSAPAWHRAWQRLHLSDTGGEGGGGVRAGTAPV